jgi:hypothetical protein
MTIDSHIKSNSNDKKEQAFEEASFELDDQTFTLPQGKPIASIDLSPERLNFMTHAFPHPSLGLPEDVCQIELQDFLEEDEETSVNPSPSLSHLSALKLHGHSDLISESNLFQKQGPSSFDFPDLG